MQEFNHLDVVLSGTNLIDASAGTGKTYAISCLYLRLLIESGLTPEQILVVTYTEAATKELRGRIRCRIREMLNVLDGAVSKDPFLCGLHTRILSQKDQARERLDLALKSFDTASIYTIHAFCLRALQDNSFESGSTYETELVTDPTPLLQEVVDDFWRGRFFVKDAPLYKQALKVLGRTPDSLLGFVKKFISFPLENLLPTFRPEQIVQLEQEIATTYRALQDCWEKSATQVQQMIYDDKGLRRTKGVYRADNLPGLFDDMDSYLGQGRALALFSDFDKFCSSTIANNMKKNTASLQHLFFDLCQSLKETIDQRLNALRWELIVFCKHQLLQRKRTLNIRFFDDLLADLNDALHSPSAQTLIDILAGRYRAALIDEFQDTDPIQFSIFDRLFHKSTAPLFLIGDPKQAIYSFRGADIFAYLQAASGVGDDKRFTLTGNWRSTPELLQALNLLFNRQANPFVFERISYHEVSSGNPEGRHGVTFDGKLLAPLQLCYPHETQAIKSADALELIPGSVAGEIGRLLEGPAKLAEKDVVPEDIAVIVRTHMQAEQVYQALQARGIPCVIRSNKSLFSTGDVADIAVVLTALADPANGMKLRAALATPLLGSSAEDIADYLVDESVWETVLEHFQHYGQLWHRDGFMVMAQALLDGEDVRNRLLAYPDGERRMTNILHALEVLHQQVHRRRLGPEGLLAWLTDKMSRKDQDEEHQIRLETDEKAVKIVTVHVSKGLEYPIVFCPFMWSGISETEPVVSFHEEFRLLQDYGSDQFAINSIKARRESLAEQMRLLYVALTRAQSLCYLYCGDIRATKNNAKQPQTSPVSFLLHADATTRECDMDTVAALKSEVATLSTTDVVQQLKEIESNSQSVIASRLYPPRENSVVSLQDENSGIPLNARTFRGKISTTWHVGSFTSLAAQHHPGLPQRIEYEERENDDFSLPADLEQSPPDDIFLFPKGAKTGVFWHDIFERLDFSAATPAHVDELVTCGLEAYDFEPWWRPCLNTMVNAVVNAALPAEDGPFTLAELTPGSWIAEMEFFLPLRLLYSDRLADCLRDHRSARAQVDLAQMAQKLGFAPIEGMLRGFIDLIFTYNGRYYLLDWKSNHLGNSRRDYDNAALQNAMVEHLYPLQYLLYTVALDRYLTQRVADYSYETHFGGVYYLFLRGVDAASMDNHGIFSDRPSAELISDLRALLVDMEGVTAHA